MDSKTEALLMMASRAQLTKEAIIPKLQNGSIVISDRYIDSTIAYQGAGRGLDIEILDKINAFVTNKLKPDITYLIDVPSVIASKRRGRSKLDRIERVGVKFQELVRNQYIKLAMSNQDRFITLNGLPNAESIHDIIWNTFKSKIKNRRI
jgi:dTMP kinase